MTHSTTDSATLNLDSIFQKKKLVVIGGTGFLGKVWLSLFLHRFPTIGHLYLLVRSKKDLTSEQRFWRDVVTSEALDPLREQHGDAFEAFIRDKITPVDGDVTRSFVGLDDDLIEGLKGSIDAVVNVAGVVDFNPPIDEGIKVNCFGVKHIAELCKALGDVPLMHTSTCYVAGNRDGAIQEENPLDRPFPRCGEIDIRHWDPEREIEEGLRLTERARHEANEAFRESEFLEQAKKNLRRKGESCRGAVLEDELQRVRDKYVRDMLSNEGQKRADYWGWTNTYTYTKSIGEQLLLRSGLPVTIVRPAIIESSSFYPFPGWNEGINTSAPLIYIILNKGAPHLPGSWDCVLDIIPCDMVCSGMIASLAELLIGEHKTVYQYGSGDVNPCSTARMQDIISLYKRRDRRKNPRGNPLMNALQKSYGSMPVSEDYFRKYAEPAYARTARSLSRLTKKASSVPGLGFLRGTSKTLASTARQLENTAKIFETFLPFMLQRRYRFECINTRSAIARLDEESRQKLHWSPEEIDWRLWFTEVHIPGLEKWVMPLIDEKLRKETKQLRRYSDLLSMMEERVDDNYYGVCMQMLIDDRLHRLTYGDFRKGVYGVAQLLHEAGLKRGDRVLLAGANSPYWGLSYFGILQAGAVAVPVDPDLDLARLRNISTSSNARFAIWDKDFYAQSGKALEQAKSSSGNIDFASFQMNEFCASALALDAEPRDLDIRPDDVASLIFTSGTTGDPKGVMLTHDNFTSILSSLVPLFPLNHRDCSLSLLPLHHTFEFTCGLLLPLSCGTRITYIDELTGDNVVSAMKKTKVTALVGVPALWQLLARRIESRVRDRGNAASTLFNFLLNTNRSIGKSLGVDLGKMLFSPVHKEFGGHLRILISGGAALPKDTQKLFAGLGLHLTEGYGLTEAAPVLTVAKPSVRAKFGSVGKAIPGVEVKIDSPNKDGIGEVLAKGDNVMLGYAENPRATQAVLSEDGWLHTGDLGKIDHKGRLTIVGRAKDVIVTTSGENVYPDDLEDMIGLPDSVEELTVVGLPDPKGDEQVALLAVPKKTSPMSNGIDFSERSEQARKDLKKRFKDVPRAMRPTVVHFQPNALPRTATRKVKRKVVQEALQRMEHESRQDLPAVFTPLAEQIADVLSRLTGASKTQVRNSKRLAADLGIDSLMMNELQVELEELVGHELPSEKLAACETLSELQLLLEQEGLSRKQKNQEEAFKRKHPESTKKKKDEGVRMPEFMQDLAKELILPIQLSFYNKVMDVRVEGKANIPHNRNTIIAANHCSHLDLGLIKSALGEYGHGLMTLGAKDYFFEGDKARQFFFENLTNVIPVERKGGSDDGLRGAREALNKGKTLLIFPEGSRGSTGVITTFRSGIGYLALESKIDILPIYVEGSFDAMPKGRPLPTRRDLYVRIGAVLPYEEFSQKIDSTSKQEAARNVARMCQEAVEHLRDRKPFELSAFDPSAFRPETTVAENLKQLFGYLHNRFDSERVEKPVSFYFSLGKDNAEKWSLVVDKNNCKAHIGKPEGGSADCVLKTSPEIFRRIVKEAYVPAPEQFISGAIKSNNIPLLQDFVRIFNLQ